jgi:hypothetical protein
MKIGKFQFIKDRPLVGNSWTHRDAANPDKWPWWKLFHLSYVNLSSVKYPSWGRRLWIYTKRKAHNFDIYFDSRGNL